MSELAFNELSFDTTVTTTSHAISLFQNFFDICDSINMLNLGHLKIRAHAKIGNCSFQGIRFTLYDYFDTISNENRARYSTFLAQLPLLNDNPYYKFEKNEAIGFGHSYETGNVSVSINNPDNWKENSYSITREYLSNELNAEIEVEKKDIIHLPYLEKLPDLISYFTDLALKKTHLDLKGIQSIEDFWQNKSVLFTMLDFSTETENLLLKFGSINNPNFIKVMNYLEKLNLHLIEVGFKKKQFDQFPGNISLDTAQTLTRFGAERIFSIPSGGTAKFSLHAKVGSVRIYLLPDETKGRVTVGHIGDHLRTTRYH